MRHSAARARRWIRSAIAGFLIALVLGLALPPTSAQNASPSPGKASEAVSTAPWWEPSKAYHCGRLLCSEAAFPSLLTRLKGTDPMVLTIEPTPDASLESQQAVVEARSRTVEATVTGIIEQLQRREQRQKGPDSDGRAERPPFTRSDGPPPETVGRDLPSRRSADNGPKPIDTRFPTFWLITTAKPTHPDTPRVEVGIRNDQTVIFLAPDAKEKLAQVTVVTVTEPDATHAGLAKEELAQRWRQTLRMVFSEALWGMEFNRHFPLARQLIVGGILMLAAGVGLGVLLIFKRLRRLQHRLRRLLRTIESKKRDEANEAFGKAVSARAEGEAPAAVSPTAPVRADPDQNGGSETQVPLSDRRLRRTHSLASLERFLDQIFVHRERIKAVPSLQPHRIRQVLNLANLMGRVLLLAAIVVVAVGGVGLFLIFPSTREAALFVALQSLAIPLLWMSLALAQPLLELVIDQGINVWRADAELEDPGSSRFGLRASTYSEVLKMLTGFLFVAVGLYGTILILGVDPTILAGAGAIAIAIGFLARSLLEDILSGLMILLNDRFAIGDVIHVDDKSGLVEAMNLHITRLRGSDGRLTSIPNRQINIVDNLTQNWARVDFTLRIAAWADGRRALEVIAETARRMWQDPEWRLLIREEPAVLGVDEISHAGALIRVWISTQPLKQWMVGREFRLRIQEALRREGIPLGVPQQLIRLPEGPALADPVHQSSLHPGVEGDGGEARSAAGGVPER